ncbi:T9SS type A sorting domain-containing protein [candidate division KSB1 bacterium]|nr:T9SS type A sorting domain-containing protein [candidate division KSB1 bacterium]
MKIILTLLIMFIFSVSFLFAVGTPFWWDNSYGYDQWYRATGVTTQTNIGAHAVIQLISIDVPNEFHEELRKTIWMQLEWTVVQGQMTILDGPTDMSIKWNNDPNLCPANPLDPFPDPPDGSGFLSDNGIFSPENGYANGWEYSYESIQPQPACERIELRIEMAPNTIIEYMFDVQTICLNWDYGDAPDPFYPTLAVNNGACHAIVPSMFLGTTVDSEPDGQPDPLAAGDDGNGSNDEDGVQFTTPIVHNTNAQVTVTASNSGILNAWLDFNNDGDWADAGEHIFFNTALVPGANNLAFFVPAAISHNVTTAVRFRFSSMRNLSYLGPAYDGEVEDYLVDVLTPVELSSFNAVFKYNAVELTWTTESETENAGFNIYRTQDGNENFQKINKQLIPGAGNTTAVQKYSYRDTDIEPGKNYFYKVSDVSYDGIEKMSDPVSIRTAEPAEYRLEQNYPNPFNPETQITFHVKDAGYVKLAVFNVKGQHIKTLVSENVMSGSHTVVWNGTNEKNTAVPSGIYFATLRVNDYQQIIKMDYIK